MGSEERDQPGTPGEGQADEEELRARLEEELRKVRVEDLLLQSVASIVNLTARRIAKPDERDLGQAKVGIDAVRGLVDLLPAEAAGQVRQALSELQMLYAREAAGAEGEPGQETPSEEGEPGQEEAAPKPPPRPGRRGEEPPPRLWTPPGTS